MSSTEQQLLQSIKNQTKDQGDDEVYVIEIEGIQTKEIPKKVQRALEKFTALQMLSINNCGIEDLTNFPENKALIRLDLIANKITGDQLAHLQKIRHLQTLFLGHNEIKIITDLNQITHFTKLIQLDLVSNDICDIEDYRKKVFEKFPSLKILDNENKEGKYYQGKTLVESANRVNVNLFEKPKMLPQSNLFGNSFQPQQPQIQTSLFQNPFSVQQSKPAKQAPKKKDQPKLKPVSQRFNKKNSQNISTTGKTKVSTNQLKYSLDFPVGRISRYLRQKTVNTRIGKTSGIYLAAVLEYLAAEILELAGEQAKINKRVRILPKDISFAIKNDTELNRMFTDLTISEGGFRDLLFKQQ